VFVIWAIKLIEISSGMSFAFFGIYPLKAQGLIGIITAPLIHKDFNHLISNTIPFLIFSVGVFYFYRPLGYKIFFLTWLMTGIWVWCGAREAYHIGASGIVYGLASFLFFSGIIRRSVELASISLIVVFLYGSMIWGIFPFVPEISWESHLSGGVAGFILAFIYRKEGPKPKLYEWQMDETLNDEETINEEGLLNESNDEMVQKPAGRIVYLYKPKGNSKAEDDSEKK
jgi:membrane associated rhomboid family serine protease